MTELATSDLVYDALLALIFALLASWVVMLGAAVVRCLRDGQAGLHGNEPARDQHAH